MGYKEDLNKIKLQFSQQLNQAIGQSVLTPLGKEAVDTIYKRVKSGYGVDNDRSEQASRSKLKPLSKSYIEQRKGNLAFFTRNGKKIPYKPDSLGFKPGPFFSPNRSNLTRTGQMLDSISFKVTKGKVTVFIPNTGRDDNLTNKQVAEYVSKDRPFFTLTVPEQRVLFRNAENTIRKLVRLAFNRKGR